MRKKITFRSLHRDLGYFYVGLIITFSISGLFLNHRESWHPLNYEYASQEVSVPVEELGDEIDQEDALFLAEHFQLDDAPRRFGTEEESVWIAYRHSDLEFDRKTGKGHLKKFMVTPVLGQMTWLHINTNTYWIIYSDIFAVALLLIAISAIVFPKGKYSFKKYGWKLALAGLLIPLVFLLLLS